MGAGDSFIAGFLYGILQGWPVEDCLRKGAEVSSQVVQVFEPWVDEINNSIYDQEVIL